MPLEGLQLGKYRLLHLIGSGGMGDVYIGEDPNIGRQVAVKVMRAEAAFYSDENTFRERLFQREMKAIAMLDHPHILPLYDYGEQLLHKTTLLYMVMPYRQEGSFADWLRQRSKGAPLQLHEVAYFLSQAADALQHAHDCHIIHQDVKPPNFLIRRKRGSDSLPDLLLADFGIARISSLTSSASHSSRGTPTYMAPEQWSGNPEPATDQYALAIMAYELVAGRPPFHGRPEQMMYMHLSTPPALPSTVNSVLSASIDAVILRALSKKPAERFPAICDFATAFAQALEGHGDRHATLAISSAEAAAGTMRELTLPTGRTYHVVVPPGVQNGHMLRLPGLGEPYYAGGPTGQLILTLAILSENETLFVHPEEYYKTQFSSKAFSSQVKAVATGNVQANNQAFPVSPTPQMSPTPHIDEAVSTNGVLARAQSNKAFVPRLDKATVIASKPAADQPAPMPSLSQVVVSVKPEPAQKTKQQWLDEGNSLYSRGYYQQAITAYEQGLRLDPYDTALRTNRNTVRGELRATSNPGANKRRAVIWIRIIGIFLIVALFLLVNYLSSWNTAIIVITSIFGLLAFFICIYLSE